MIRGITLLLALTLVCGCERQSEPPLSSAPSESATHASTTEQLYTLDGDGSDKLSIFALPSGELKKSLLMPGYGSGYNMCADGSGNVFVPADDVIFEYAPGGKKPVAEMIDNLSPESCASDPKTGDLAVIDEEQNRECTISFYKPPKNHARVVYDVGGFPFCRYPSYDNSGNLFLAGENASESGSELAELRAGSKKFTSITLSESIADSDFMQWDGEDIALENDSGGSPDQRIIIDRIHVVGTKGTIVAKIRFKDWSQYYVPFWIGAGQLVAPEMGRDTIGIWDYPRGGRARTTFSTTSPTYALTVSSVH